LYAAIDVGSNTLRMLIGRCTDSSVLAESYQQQITRLGGGYCEESGLARESIDRTLAAIYSFHEIILQNQVEQVRLVGTAALRRAVNAQHLVNLIKMKTRLELEIISGKEEARLSAAGVLSVLKPLPQTALIVDLGGGSTEIVLYDDQQVRFSCSYPLGVVRLQEEMPDTQDRQLYLQDMVVKISSDLLHAGISPLLFSRCELIGTAGTMTTLAALDLSLENYDRQQVNNHRLRLDWLQATQQRLLALSVPERETLPGFEPGRGDIIIPGLELVIALCRYFKQQAIRVSDAGLLEGILLDFYRS